MVSRIDPISVDEWHKITTSLPGVIMSKAWGSDTARDYALDSYRLVFDALWETGAHPSVFAEPEKNKVQIKNDPGGFTLVWRRPKTRRVCVMPISRSVALGLEEYLAGRQNWPVYSTRSLLRTMRECSRDAAVPDVTPKTIRHTVAYRLFKEHGPSVAKESLGVSDKVLQDYMALNAETRVRVIRESRKKAQVDRKSGTGGEVSA